MWKRLFVLALLFAAGLAPARAGKVEQALEARWRGAWVLLTAEIRSNCDGRYTKNRINGRFSTGGGRHVFGPGELAKIENLNAHRSRVDLVLSVHEPLLVSWMDGPFTLYEELSCRVELEIEVPRQLVRSRDFDGLDRLLADVMERHVNFEDARASSEWNGRIVDPFPVGYDDTVFAWRVWKAEQHNLLVAARIEDAHRELAQLARAVGSGHVYVKGLTRGIEDQREAGLLDCPRLIASGPPRGALARKKGEPELPAELKRGYADGRRLVYFLDLLGRADGCIMPLPVTPETSEARLAPSDP